MYRLLMPLVLLSLAGCGHKNVGTGRDSAAPAYVPPATTANDAAREDPQATAPEAAGDDVNFAASEVASETPRPTAHADSPLPVEEQSDHPQASDTTATAAEANAPLSDVDRTAAAEEPAVEQTDDMAPDASASQPKSTRSKLFRGLANSISRAVVKTFSEPSAAPPAPLEDDPFPNGEPADADPDVNR